MTTIGIKTRDSVPGAFQDCQALNFLSINPGRFDPPMMACGTKHP
jgi:hypothetical protein